MSFERDNIKRMAGYASGEQPDDTDTIKLNTNENPYPPSPKALAALADGAARLNRYPDPVASGVRIAAAELYGLASPDWVLVGNGSDDLLTIAVRSFVGEGETLACLEPSYSLYPVLSAIQDATCRLVPLTPDFGLPDDLAAQAAGAKLFFLTNPNAPTGNAFPVDQVERFCREFEGVVLIDEAYADFAEGSCLALVEKLPNVIVSRTLSKGYGLAGIRLGVALGNPDLIEGMMKVKDSYNVNALSQAVGEAALRDQEWLRETRAKVIATRQRVAGELEALGFSMTTSATNFLFVKPPMAAAAYFEALRERAIVIRYFPGPVTGDWVRVTVGTDEEMDAYLAATREILGDGA